MSGGVGGAGSGIGVFSAGGARGVVSYVGVLGAFGDVDFGKRVKL